ncbi:MAG: DUF3291 domain-containing protein [Pseudomonadota bacterium]
MATGNYHLAQVNIGRIRAPLTDPLMHGFVSQLDHINRLAETSPGFVWRLQTDEGDATAIQLYDDPLVIVNLSVWESVDALKQYVYAGDHVAVLRERKSWFEKFDGPMLALWWIPAGHLPTPQEARHALDHLALAGPTQQVFTFSKPFPPPQAESGVPFGPLFGGAPA